MQHVMCVVSGLNREQRDVGPLLVVGVLAVLAAAVLPPSEARAQPGRTGTETARSESVVQQWRLRGVVLAEAGRFAMLQHRTGSRPQLVRVGDVLERGVALVTIGADRVVLDAEGREVTLRLAHGAERVSRPVPVPRTLPRSIGTRRGR
jgi:hypothetical protein